MTQEYIQKLLDILENDTLSERAKFNATKQILAFLYETLDTIEEEKKEEGNTNANIRN